MFKNNKKSNSNLFFNYGKFSKRYKKHEYYKKITKNQIVTYPLIMVNFAKGIKNINIIIDMINSKRDENREKNFVKI